MKHFLTILLVSLAGGAFSASYNYVRQDEYRNINQINDTKQVFQNGQGYQNNYMPIYQNVAPITTTTEYFLDSFKNGILRELTTLKKPVNEILTSAMSWKCNAIKNTVGIEYRQIKDQSEPDLNLLTLEYRDKSVRVVYNISDASRQIPLAMENSTSTKLILFIHGFWANDPAQINTISEALSNRGEHNVLALDTTSLMSWWYFRSTTYVRFFGEKLGETLAAMIHRGISPDHIHIIGNGLGSHIAGFTGKKFFELTSRRVGRITGLDPAGPCYSHEDPELRLKITDADFVDVIHTDGGVLGLYDAIGHADFYPNAGSQQPNCFFEKCNHNRAWIYYAESILNPDSFPALKCVDWNQFKIGQCNRQDISNMGHGARITARGKYYLQTGQNAPYGIGEAGTVYVNHDGIIKTVTTGVKDTFNRVGKTLCFWCQNEEQN